MKQVCCALDCVGYFLFSTESVHNELFQSVALQQCHSELQVGLTLGETLVP